MFSNTHAYIAEKVFKYLKNNNGIEINKTFFKYGSVKPDFAPRLVNIGHYEEESMDFILDEISTLSSLPYQDEEEFLKQYSIKLGVIIHYLSDYFCHAHNNYSFKKDILKHLVYEARLESLINRFESSILNNGIQLLPRIYPVDIKNYIGIELDNYKRTEITYFNDLKYAIRVSCNVCSSILKLSFERNSAIAA